MWQLMHRLFGWDYIAWRNSVDQGVARVQKDGLGRVWYWRYRSTSVADFVVKPEHVLWLTCRPEKYFKGTEAKQP